MHHDISFGNIIINEEIYCDTNKDFEWIYVDLDRVALVRRETVDIGASGGLHDLDMAAYIPETVFIQQSKRPPANTPQVGTLPFMSIGLLLGGQHAVLDDRLPNSFPNAPPPLCHRWPGALKKWTDSVAKDMDDLGSNKSNFFLSDDDHWFNAIKNNALSLWSTSTGNKTLKWNHWDMVATFHKQLWVRKEVPVGRKDVPLQTNIRATPLTIRMALQKTMDSLDMSSEIPLE
ncbi:hypothetical protein C0993_004966 [Termitomyces sp. T159_Od127]|nr:hypothetical protein C0993_004966 [Termitomyces sp. T159_Od127]